MEKEKIRKRLLKILEIAPALKDIMLSSDGLKIKRKKIRGFLSEMLTATFEDDPKIPPLEWIMTRDAITVFRHILSTRSERLAGFSLLAYLNDILHSKDPKEVVEKPSPGFFAELEHLFRGVTGNTKIYSEKVPAFLKQGGAKAARLRSGDLSRMARSARKFLDRYSCGLDKKIIRRRSVNKSRILKYFGATELEWEDWKWHTRHIIRGPKTLSNLIRLTEEEYEAIKLAREYRIPFGITPYYVSLMDYEANRKRDYAVRAQVIPTLHYVKMMKEIRSRAEHSMDFMLERDTSPVEGITRRYPNIVILKPILTCPQICVY